MIEVLHNPRCGKSRNCLAFLDEKNIEYKKFSIKKCQRDEFINGPASKRYQAAIYQFRKKLKSINWIKCRSERMY